MTTKLQKLKEDWMIIVDGNLQSEEGGRSSVKTFTTDEKLKRIKEKGYDLKKGQISNNNSQEWWLLKINLWTEILNEYERVVTEDPKNWEELKERYGAQFSELQYNNFGSTGINKPTSLTATFSNGNTPMISKARNFGINISDLGKTEKERTLDSVTEDESYKKRVLDCVRMERVKLHKLRLTNPAYIPKSGFTEDFQQTIKNIAKKEEAEILHKSFKYETNIITGLNIKAFTEYCSNTIFKTGIENFTIEQGPPTRISYSNNNITHETREIIKKYAKGKSAIFKEQDTVIEEFKDLKEKLNSLPKILKDLFLLKNGEINPEIFINNGDESKVLAAASTFLFEHKESFSQEQTKQKSLNDLILLQLERIRNETNLEKKGFKLLTLRNLIVLRDKATDLDDNIDYVLANLETTKDRKNLLEQIPLNTPFRQQGDSEEFVNPILDIIYEAITEKTTSTAIESNQNPTPRTNTEPKIKTLPTTTIKLSFPEKVNSADTITVESMLSSMQKDQILEQENQVEFGNKKLPTNQKVIPIVNKETQELVIQLKRYDKNNRKINNKVSLTKPLEFLVKNSTEKRKFEVTAFIVQGGGTSGGHYASYVKENNNWYCYNDSEKTPLGNDLPDAAKDAYIFKYSDTSLTKTHPENLPKYGTNNLGNTCFANAGMAFTLSLLSSDKQPDLEQEKRKRLEYILDQDEERETKLGKSPDYSKLTKDYLSLKELKEYLETERLISSEMRYRKRNNFSETSNLEPASRKVVTSPPPSPLLLSEKSTKNVDDLTKALEATLTNFNSWGREEIVEAKNNAHFDWWTFPINESATKNKFISDNSKEWAVNNDAINSLKNNTEYMSKYRLAVTTYLENAGWDYATKEISDDYLANKDEYPHSVRLAKILLSAFVLHDKQTQEELYHFRQKVEEKLRFKENINQWWGTETWDTPLYANSNDSDAIIAEMEKLTKEYAPQITPTSSKNTPTCILEEITTPENLDQIISKSNKKANITETNLKYFHHNTNLGNLPSDKGKEITQNNKSDFATDNDAIIKADDKAKAADDLVQKSLKEAIKTSKLDTLDTKNANYIAATFALIARKNNGIGNNISDLLQDLENLQKYDDIFKKITANELSQISNSDNSKETSLNAQIRNKITEIAQSNNKEYDQNTINLAIAAINFSRESQKEMGKNQMYSGNPNPANFVDRRLKRVDPFSIANLSGKENFAKICKNLGGIAEIEKEYPPTKSPELAPRTRSLSQESVHSEGSIITPT